MTLEIFSIILSVVSLIISVLAFFASLWFFIEGGKLQKLANEALIQIQERTGALQTQVGGIFQQTLDAAIGRRADMLESFEDLNQQLKNTERTLLNEVTKKGDVPNAGEESFRNSINEELEKLRQKISSTRLAAEEVSSDQTLVPVMLAREIQQRLTDLLKTEAEGLSADDIVERLWHQFPKTYLITNVDAMLRAGILSLTKRSDGKFVYCLARK